MDSSPLQSRRDYREATARLIPLLEADPAPGSREALELESLVAAVQQYETKHFPIDPPTPEEAIQFRLDQMSFQSPE